MHSALLFFVFLTFCYGDGFYEGDSIVKAGVRAFYNYSFDESVEILTEAREKYPNHPGVHMIWAASRWVRAKAIYSTERSNQLLEADLKTIQQLLGHESITTTEIYMHLDNKALVNVMNKFHPRSKTT